MDNSGQIRCVLLYNKKCIFRRITTVDIYRKPDLSRQIKLSDEPLLLNLSRLHIPVVIKTNLTDSNHLRIVTHFLQTRQRIIVQLADLVRMDTDSRINCRILMCQRKCIFTCLHRSTHRHNCFQPTLL